MNKEVVWSISLQGIRTTLCCEWNAIHAQKITDARCICVQE